MRLAHQSPGTVVRWLRRQPDVRAARIERDGSSVTILFEDGGRIEILPRFGRTASIRAASPRLFLRQFASPAGGGGRALVLEPFASELGVGSHAGDPEVSDLQSAGFQVTQAYDTQVTVASMASLSQYNVVYMHTHTGPTGVVGTGQITTCMPYTSPDGTVVTVGVAGSTQCYYAITSQYITERESQFPNHALVFINGCALLNSGDFWGALSSKGVGAFLSWDNDSRTYDDFLSAAAFFNQMSQGATVSSALNTLYSAGYGRSTYQDAQGTTTQATLGYRGDGALTLAQAGASTINPPTIPPTATPTATATSLPIPTSTPTPVATKTSAPPTAVPTPTQPAPTSTPHPTATATATTPGPTLALAAAVTPGHVQTVTVQNAAPNTKLQLTITFPNGDRLKRSATADPRGLVSFSFRQAASKITRTSNEARVDITGTGPSGRYTLSAKYTIGFGPVDVFVHPRRQRAGHWIAIYIHSTSRRYVNLTVKLPGRRTARRRARTGAHGWVKVHYKLPKTLRARKSVAIRADVYVRRKDKHSSSSVTIS